MTRRLGFKLMVLSLAIGACDSSGVTTQGPTPGQTTPPPASAASPSALEATPEPTPGLTLASTAEDAAEAPQGAIAIEMGAFGPPRFRPDQVTATAGQVVLFLDNVGDRYEGYHDFVIGEALYQALTRSPAINAGDSVLFTVKDMPLGTYTFWCEVERHASLGMVGTLTVTP